MALSLTCKSNAYDELSLIQLIDNELTRSHQVRTVDEAIGLWKQVYDQPLLKQWVTATESIVPTRDMLSEAKWYDVMLGKMLQAIPESQRLYLVSEQDAYGWTLLHKIAFSGNVDSVRAIIRHYPASQYWQVVTMCDRNERKTVLHVAASADCTEMIEFLLGLLPESQRLEAATLQDGSERTVLHCASESLFYGESTIRFLISLFPEAQQRLKFICMTDRWGRTVLHCATNSVESIEAILRLLPESMRAQAASVQDRDGWTVLHRAVYGKFKTITTILHLLPESQRSQVVCLKEMRGQTVLDFLAEEPESQKAVLDLLPESGRPQVTTHLSRAH